MPKTRTYFPRTSVSLVKQKIAIGEAMLETTPGEPDPTAQPPNSAVPISAPHLEGGRRDEEVTQTTSLDSVDPQWQKFYREALLELDREKLMMRVAAAERAMRDRLQEIAPTGEPLELREIEDAIATLRALRRTELAG